MRKKEIGIRPEAVELRKWISRRDDEADGGRRLRPPLRQADARHGDERGAARQLLGLNVAEALPQLVQLDRKSVV